MGRLESVEEDDLRRQLELNVVGTSLLTRLFAKGTRDVDDAVDDTVDDAVDTT